MFRKTKIKIKARSVDFIFIFSLCWDFINVRWTEGCHSLDTTRWITIVSPDILFARSRFARTESRFAQSIKSFGPEYKIVSPDIYFMLFFSKGAFLTGCKQVCDDRSSPLSRHLDSSVSDKNYSGYRGGKPRVTDVIGRSGRIIQSQYSIVTGLFLFCLVGSSTSGSRKRSPRTLFSIWTHQTLIAAFYFH